MSPPQDALFWLFLVCIIAAALTALTLHSLVYLFLSFLSLSVSLYTSYRIDWNPDDWQQTQQRLPRMRAEEVAQELLELLHRVERDTSELVSVAFRQWARQNASLVLKRLLLLTILQMVVIGCATLLGWWNIAAATLTWLTVAAIYGAAIVLAAIAIKRASNQAQTVPPPNEPEEPTASLG